MHFERLNSGKNGCSKKGEVFKICSIYKCIFDFNFWQIAKKLNILQGNSLDEKSFKKYLALLSVFPFVPLESTGRKFSSRGIIDCL